MSCTQIKHPIYTHINKTHERQNKEAKALRAHDVLYTKITKLGIYI